MAKPITEIKHTELTATLRCLGDAKATIDHADWMRGRGNAALVVEFINSKLGSYHQCPHRLSVKHQMTLLKRTSGGYRWGITGEDYSRLEKTAPPWPEGRHAYRSFRIRFGEGDEGVAKTIHAHGERIRGVFGEEHVAHWEFLSNSGIRLLNGNHTHKPVVEWIWVDLAAHRERDSVEAVRGPDSLADELLVMAWMFPNLIRYIDYDLFPGLFAAGYEINPSEDQGNTWRHAMLIRFDKNNHRVDIRANTHVSDGTGYSVPRLLEIPEGLTDD